MGSSCSDEAKPLRGGTIKPDVNAYIKSMNHYRHSQLQTERIQRLQKWKQMLIEFISIEDAQDIFGWSVIQNALIQYLDTLPAEKNVEWITNAQFTTLTSPTYCAQFMARGEDSVVDLDHLEKSGSVFYAHKHWSEIESPNHAKSDREAYGTTLSLRVAPKHFARSQIFRSFQSKVSAKEELRRNLLNQLASPNHIILGLIKTFVPLCENLYTGSSENLIFEEYSQQHEEIYCRIAGNIKRFISSVKKFINWIYEDLLFHLENGLDQEDLTTNYVVESVLYEILFKITISNLGGILYKLIQLKHKDSIDHLRILMAEKKEDKLESYDSVIKKAELFLLRSSPKPYKKVSRKILTVRFESNPYSKYDILASLDEQIWGSICDYYNHDEEVLKKLKESFGADFRVPILIYSIVQSQWSEIIVEMKFIDEFICSDVKNSSFGFLTFESSLDYLVNGSSQDSNEEIEIQGLEEI